jgi:hypothetical protein
MQPAKARSTEYERAEIKKWCKLATGIKAKINKTRDGYYYYYYYYYYY